MAAARSTCGDALQIRPVQSGLHAIAELPPDLDAVAVSAAAAKRGVEALPVSTFYADPRDASNALVFGFGAVHPERALSAMEKLAAALADVSRTAP